jgi:hypothetical protein
MRFEADDFQGLTPSVDARKSDKIFALGGRNYVFDSFGPRSVFGNRYVTPYPLGSPSWSQGMRLRLRTGDHVFVFTSDSILEWSESLGGWRVLYYFDTDLSEHPYRWSGDYLSGIMFFCHPATGILAYEIAADVCLPLHGPGVPEQAIALCQCNGRIVTIDETAYSWSAPGDGTKWDPELGGAGFQVINARVSGYPIMVDSYGRGTITWTTGGVMRSEFTGDSSVFRHRALVTEYRPINSFSSFRLDNDTIVLLDERGFFRTQGETPEALTPVFNEFLIDYLQRNNLKLGTNCRVEFDDIQRRVYLSVSQSFSSPLFEKAFVLYTSLDKWGTFDEDHYGILPLLIKDSSRADDYFGFVDADARVRFWDFGASREILPDDTHFNSRYPLIQKPAVQMTNGDAVILGSSMELNTFDTSAFTQRAGYYGVAGTSPATSNVTGLDSVVQLGFIRARGDDSYDRLTEISQIMVGSIVANPYFFPTEDYNLIPNGVSDEDYNAETGGEDFGIEDVSYTNHGIRVIPTIDGRSAWNDPVTPELITFQRASREYSCSAVGMFHILELSATEVGEAYHVRTLELTALDAGRLN